MFPVFWVTLAVGHEHLHRLLMGKAVDQVCDVVVDRSAPFLDPAASPLLVVARISRVVVGAA